MIETFPFPRTRWLVHALIVGTVLVTACGWIGGTPPTPTIPATAPPAASPSPQSTLAPPLPSPSPSPSPSPAPTAGGTYTVAEGDTLATIAEQFYGDPSQWQRIYDANRDTIGDNPDNVRVGTTLQIPPGP